MTPEEYKQLAKRTENTPNFIVKHRIVVDIPTVTTSPEYQMCEEADRRLSRMMHAILGMITELGELCDPLKRHLIYNAPLDVASNEKGGVREEMGDRQWYDALFFDAIDAKIEDIWQRNIAKLRARFPDRFTNEAAINRDETKEQAALNEAARIFALEEENRGLRRLNVQLSERLANIQSGLQTLSTL